MTYCSTCPRCGADLGGLATFCYTCDEYVADMCTTAATPLPRSVDIPDDRLEGPIKEATKKALKLLGFKVYDLEQNRPTRQTEGIADLYVCGFGRCTWAEMKKADGVQSADQAAFEQTVTTNSAEYHVWRHENEAIEWAKAAIKAAA